MFAQQYNFRSWTLSDGLPQSTVNDLLQDHRLQLWIATRGGVSRFDGNTFHTYSKQQGLASNNASTLFQDSRKNIWIGSTDNGLTRFDGHSFKTFSSAAGLPGGGVTAITEDKQGKLWIATDSGIYTLEGEQFLRSSEFPPQPYLVLLTDATGTIWAGSKNDGLYKLQRGKLSHFASPNYSLPSNTIQAIFSEEGTGKVWIGTANGPACLEEDVLRKIPLPASVKRPAVSDFTKDAYGNMIIGLQNDGVLLIGNSETKHLTRANGLSSNRITALLTDTEDNVWIGTNGYGLQQNRAPWFLHYFEIGDLKEPRITALAQDAAGKIWFGTDNGNTGFMQHGTPTMLHSTPWPAGTTLYSMWITGENNVWVGSAQGVWNLKPGATRHFTTAQGLPSDEVYFVTADEKGSLWFATAGGVARLHNNKPETITTIAGTSPGKVYCIYRDRRNRLWFGADSGIYFLENNKLHKFSQLAQHSFGEVTAIVEDKKGWLYFGGYNYGLLAYHQGTGQAKLFTASHGLPNEGIKSLYTDRDNNLWAATNNTVLKIDLLYFHKTKKLKFREYGNHNGFRGLEVSLNGITQTPDGKVWFGTARGLTQYTPALDHINKDAPKLYLTDIKLFMHTTDWKEMGHKIDYATGLPVNLQLPYNKTHITFFYHGICFTNPSRVKYQYMIEGVNHEWSEISDRHFATYANLAPGTYTFKLRAQNNDGYWTQEPLLYTFSVMPPVWRREWFIGVLLLIATATIISVIRFREQSLVKMNTLLDLRVKHRTRMLERKNREKELLLQEVHHRVKNNLQIVISLLNLQARHVSDPEALEVMQALRSRVRSMALLHERLYRHDNLEHIDLENYFREICTGLYAAYGITESEVQLLIKMPPIEVDIDTAITLGLIVNELVSNTLKYAFPDTGSGKLAIELQQQQEKKYQLIVWDNGIGSLGEHNKQSFGLQLVSSLIKKLNGSIIFENNNGTKAILYFTLPS
ncbi:MAG TPA: two-component regulator propeller domain-containing protein [Pontibacter sp.]